VTEAVTRTAENMQDRVRCWRCGSTARDHECAGWGDVAVAHRSYVGMGGRLPGWHVRDNALQIIAALAEDMNDVLVRVTVRPTAMQMPCHDDHPMTAP